MKLIKVVTITFNDLKGLERTYRSLKKIENYLYEWIVIDGGSNDGTKDWLENFNDTYLKFTWVSEKDNGIYDAMNKGINFLEKKNQYYVIFMNSGDEFHPEFNIEGFINNVKKYSPKLYYGSANMILNENLNYIATPRPPKHIKIGMPTSHQAMFFDERIFNKIQYSLKYKYSSDYNLLCTILKEFGSEAIQYEENIVCKFYMDGVSVIHRKKALKENFDIRVKTLNSSYFSAGILYMLHYIHTVLKKSLPNLMILLRRVV